MNIGFFDPISERWIRPRPEPEREIPPAMSLGEALIAATEAAQMKERNEKIWALLKQTAEGVNAPSAPGPTAAPEPVMIYQERAFYISGGGEFYVSSGDKFEVWSSQDAATGSVFVAPMVASEPSEYVAVESLGYVF